MTCITLGPRIREEAVKAREGFFPSLHFTSCRLHLLLPSTSSPSKHRSDLTHSTLSPSDIENVPQWHPRTENAMCDRATKHQRRAPQGCMALADPASIPHPISPTLPLLRSAKSHCARRKWRRLLAARPPRGGGLLRTCPPLSRATAPGDACRRSTRSLSPPLRGASGVV